jgi:hypothetical protein
MFVIEGLYAHHVSVCAQFLETVCLVSLRLGDLFALKMRVDDADRLHVIVRLCVCKLHQYLCTFWPARSCS